MSMSKKLKGSKLLKLLDGVHDNEVTCGLSVLLRVNAKLLHSRKERCTVNPQPGGSSIGATDAALACGEHAHNLVALPSGIFLSNPVFVISPVGTILKEAVLLFEDCVLGLVRVRLSQFSDWSL